MKHFFIVFSCWLIAFMAVSCDKEPVNFQLDVGGTLYEAATNITADIDVKAANVSATYFNTVGKPTVLLTSANTELYYWLVDKVKRPIERKVGKGGKYDITVTGYISWKGLKFEVNEHWKSPDALATSSITIVDTKGFYIAHDKSRWRDEKHTSTHYARFDYVGY